MTGRKNKQIVNEVLGEVKRTGNSGHIIVPAGWIGKKVRVIVE